MKKRYSLAFWVLLVLFVGLGMWWTFHVPHRPNAIFEPLPSNATLVTVHENLARDIDMLTRQRPVRDFLLSAGIRESDVNGLSSNKETRAWIRHLASRGTAIAYVPTYGHQLKPAWVFASWIGGQSITLRWKLHLFRSADLRPIMLDHGHTVWMARTKLSRPDQFLSLALVDGMVLGCISSDPIGAHWLIETQEGHPTRPSILSSGQLDAARLQMPGHGPHWGWFNAIPGIDSSCFAKAPVAFKAAITDRGSISFSLTTKHSLPHAGILSTNSGYTTLNRLLGSSPDLIAVIPLSWVRPLVQRSATALWADTLEQWSDPQDAAPDALAFVAVLNRNHSGRIKAALGKSVSAFVGKGLRVPTILVGIQVRRASDAAGRMNRTLGALNSRYGLALTAQPTRIDEANVMTISDARESFYGKFEPREQVAYTVQDDWMIIASNAEILGRLLNRSASSSDAPGGGMPVVSDVCAMAWVDLNGCGKTFKEAIAAGQLALMLNESGRSADVRRTLNAATEWIDRLQGFEEAAIAMKSAAGGTSLDLRLGR